MIIIPGEFQLARWSLICRYPQCKYFKKHDLPPTWKLRLDFMRRLNNRWIDLTFFSRMPPTLQSHLVTKCKKNRWSTASADLEDWRRMTALIHMRRDCLKPAAIYTGNAWNSYYLMSYCESWLWELSVNLVQTEDSCVDLVKNIRTHYWSLMPSANLSKLMTLQCDFPSYSCLHWEHLRMLQPLWQTTN